MFIHLPGKFRTNLVDILDNGGNYIHKPCTFFIVFY